jgi:hypothetical protein
MRHAWLWIFAIGCGSSSNGGEPQLGDATLNWGSQAIHMSTGSAIMGTAGMQVQLGNDSVDCKTNLDQTEPPPGSYVYFSVPPAVGATAMADLTIVKFTGNNISIDVTQGMANIASLDTRVMGTLTFTTTDSMASPNTVTMTGAFDVKKCF